MAALVFAVGGCGGGNKSAEKTAYIAKADRICQTTKAQAAPLVAQLAGAATSGSVSASQARKLARVAARLQSLGQGYLTSLEGLPQPSGDHAKIQRFLDPSRQVVDQLGRAASALRAGNVTGALALLQTGAPAADEANSAAQDYGFKQCVSVFPSGG